MDEHDRSTYPRSVVFFAALLLHGSLILVFLREKPAYTDQDASPEVPTTVFFVHPQPPLPLPPPETAPIPRRPTTDLRHRSRPDTATPSPDTTAPSDERPAAAPPIDWSAEAHQSASEITARGESGRATASPASPAAPAPWDSRPLLEWTGHGLKLRIPVDIPGRIIDSCFGNLDLDHDERGHRELYQLKCAFGKQPARGDLFDSLRKPSAAAPLMPKPAPIP